MMTLTLTFDLGSYIYISVEGKSCKIIPSYLWKPYLLVWYWT